MSLIKLPFWDLFERIYKNDYPSLAFETSDYWMYLSIFIMLSVVIVMIPLVVYNHYRDRKKEKHIHKPLYSLIKNEDWDKFFEEHFNTASFEKRNEIIKTYSIKKAQ